MALSERYSKFLKEKFHWGAGGVNQKESNALCACGTMISKLEGSKEMKLCSDILSCFPSKAASWAANNLIQAAVFIGCRQHRCLHPRKCTSILAHWKSIINHSFILRKGYRFADFFSSPSDADVSGNGSFPAAVHYSQWAGQSVLTWFAMTGDRVECFHTACPAVTVTQR